VHLVSLNRILQGALMAALLQGIVDPAAILAACVLGLTIVSHQLRACLSVQLSNAFRHVFMTKHSVAKLNFDVTGPLRFCFFIAQ
jgi:hypothetical protein